MIVVTSEGGEVGVGAAVDILCRGGTALDAVEAATRLVESDLSNHSVGASGWPNLLGRAELDASIMDGASLAAGAVGALEGYKHPISIARRVMEQLPHVLLVGEGAACFAAEVGAETSELVTAEARQGWEKWLAENVPEEVRRAWPPRELAPWVRLTADPALSHGTVNVLARDGAGHLATAVSTSGWPWKYPGRLGDSPIIGAGNYCDDRYGAATCTGVGEWAIRCGTARSVVLFQRLGYSLEAACRQAIRDLHRLDRRIAGNLNILALDREGHACGVTIASKPCPYTVWEEGMAGPETRQAEWIASEEAR